jgi:hypothetical protein
VDGSYEINAIIDPAKGRTRRKHFEWGSRSGFSFLNGRTMDLRPTTTTIIFFRNFYNSLVAIS